MSQKLSDHEVERALGYSPCVCGVLDGTWHSACYKGKTKAQIQAAYKPNMLKARQFLATAAKAKPKKEE